MERRGAENADASRRNPTASCQYDRSAPLAAYPYLEKADIREALTLWGVARRGARSPAREVIKIPSRKSLTAWRDLSL